MSSKQLQSKFKHASDFGVAGNHNPTKALEFGEAITNHINQDNDQDHPWHIS